MARLHSRSLAVGHREGWPSPHLVSPNTATPSKSCPSSPHAIEAFIREHRYTSVAGRRIAYIEVGEGDQVLFLRRWDPRSTRGRLRCSDTTTWRVSNRRWTKASAREVPRRGSPVVIVPCRTPQACSPTRPRASRDSQLAEQWQARLPSHQRVGRVGSPTHRRADSKYCGRRISRRGRSSRCRGGEQGLTIAGPW